MKNLNLYEGPELVVMLTNHDYTVENAPEIFRECKKAEARYWGMKEEGLRIESMKALYSEMKEAGKVTVLEVVSYTEEEGIKGAELAAGCGVDILMGTKFSEKIADICHAGGIRYMPFVGTVTGRPSVLEGLTGEIIDEAKCALESGADGIDLLGYRYVDDAAALNKAVCESCPGKVCIAGSIDSFQRLDEVMESGAALFTIGSAFFADKFQGSICEQINKVCRYMRGKACRGHS